MNREARRRRHHGETGLTREESFVHVGFRSICHVLATCIARRKTLFMLSLASIGNKFQIRLDIDPDDPFESEQWPTTLRWAFRFWSTLKEYRVFLVSVMRWGLSIGWVTICSTMNERDRPVKWHKSADGAYFSDIFAQKKSNDEHKCPYQYSRAVIGLALLDKYPTDEDIRCPSWILSGGFFEHDFNSGYQNMHVSCDNMYQIGTQRIEKACQRCSSRSFSMLSPRDRILFFKTSL